MPIVGGSPTDGEVIAASLHDGERFATIFDRHFQSAADCRACRFSGFDRPAFDFADDAPFDGFVQRRTGDRIGLIVFGDAPYPQAPFTLDHTTVRAMIAAMVPGMAGPRTALGDAIGLAIKMFDKSQAPEKVLVVQGTGFNWPHPDHFRLVFLPNSDDLTDAIGRIAHFLGGYPERYSP